MGNTWKKQNHLWILVGAPGSGKSTWTDQYANDENMVVVSRDKIRFSFLKEDEDYFAHETEVFYTFVDEIQKGLDSGKNVVADATNLFEKARIKLLSHLNLDDTFIHAIVFRTPLETCIERNSKREGRTKVPEKDLISMFNSMRDPIYDSVYQFDSVYYID